MCLRNDSFETSYGRLFQENNFDWETCKILPRLLQRQIINLHQQAAFYRVAEKTPPCPQAGIAIQSLYRKCGWCLVTNIGKMAVGNEILEKPDKLTDDFLK